MTIIDRPTGFNCVHLPLVYKISNDKFPINSVDSVVNVISGGNEFGYWRIDTSADIKVGIQVLDYVLLTINGVQEVHQVLEVYADDSVIVDVKAPTIYHQESPSPFTPLGAKGIGEGNSMSTPVCIANAIADSVEKYINVVSPGDLDKSKNKTQPAHGAKKTAPTFGGARCARGLSGGLSSRPPESLQRESLRRT
jgi:hypothetical protein